MFIGDRATGKTTLAMELIKPQPNSPVSVTLVGDTYDSLQLYLGYDSTSKQYAGTGGVADPSTASVNRLLHVNVKLPAGLSTIPVEWIDTYGEVWSRNWSSQNPDVWKNILEQTQKSEGIMVILPPYRGMPGLRPEYAQEFPTFQQWQNRFERWVEFLIYDCPQTQHIIFCLNFADLFCNTKREAHIISQKNWYQRHDYVVHNYFHPVKRELQQLSNEHSAFVRCFLTSIHNRSLLELPWIYLASYLA